MGSPAGIIRNFTYRDYCGWDEGRWELIDGTVFDMSPAPSRAHQSLLVALTTQLGLYFEQHPCSLFVAPFDVRLPQGDEADDDVTTVVQSDIVVVCDKSKLDERGCRGAPDWIIEILSPGTAARDQVDKLRLFEHHKVHDYWLVHPTELVATMKIDWERAISSIS